MADSVTISKQAPEQKSMQYEFLTAEGINHIQTLSGNFWTDYNVQEPGITLLEALCYGITDLGYRSAYDIKDILALNPDDPAAADIRNFYTAREIFPNVPLTLNDYRKLLIDVDGVKNAWIDPASETEVQVYVDVAKSILTYQATSQTKPLALRQLYNILLEFEEFEEPIGNLNSNTISEELVVAKEVCSALEGLIIKVKAEFPKWDDANTDFRSDQSIIAHIRSITLIFENLPAGFNIKYAVDSVTKQVVLSGTMPVLAGIAPIPDIDKVADEINKLLYVGNDSLLALYKKKIAIIHGVLKDVVKTLQANRNLGEDFYKISALKVEEIVICSSIELERDADVSVVEANIFYRIGAFLSPTVYLYSLDELTNPDPTVAEQFESENGNEDTSAGSNPLLQKERSMDLIFEGPALNHGFILDEELEAAQRKSVLHVSDLIRIIMGVPGVIAVKEIQIANIFEAADPGLMSQTVRWCLELQVQSNYVPRLNADISKLTYFKDSLPYRASKTQVDEEVKALKAAERKQKPSHPTLDRPVPEGTYRDISDYISIQNEFPQTYGIGEAGLADSETDLRKAQARQLKGYLMPFDQLMADYFAQLAHVKDLFSMNGEKDENGDFVIGHTYYTQPLINTVPNGFELYTDPYRHPVNLEKIAESDQVFGDRRNRFLDHLMARFAEQFTDYTLLSYGLEGPKAPRQLIEDKLKFLASYPAISSGRGKGFDYKDTEFLWHVDNHAGLEDRASLLTGVDKPAAKVLNFSGVVDIQQSGSGYFFVIKDPSSLVQYLQSVNNFDTADACKATSERALICGLFDTNYSIEPSGGSFILMLHGNENAIAKGVVNYASGTDAQNAIPSIIGVISGEFFNNQEANRNNLTPAIENYFTSQVQVDMLPDPPQYKITIHLYGRPFDFTSNTLLFTNTFTGEGNAKNSLEIVNFDKPQKKVEARGEETRALVPGEPIVIGDNVGNSKNYTVATFQVIGEQIFITVNESLDDWVSNPDYVLYNTQTTAEVQQAGEDKAKELIWAILTNSIFRKKYQFAFGKIDPDDPGSADGYFFYLFDRFGATVGRSFAYDFNKKLEDEINLNPSGAAVSVELLFVHNELHVTYAAPKIAEVEIRVVEALPAFAANSDISFKTRVNNIICNADKNVLSISGDYSGKILPDSVVEITDARNGGEYTVRLVISDGVNTEIQLKEGVRANSSGGSLTFIQIFPIHSFIDAHTMLIGTGPDEQEVATAIEEAVSGTISISGDATFPVMSALAHGPEVELTISGAFTGTAAGDRLSLISAYDSDKFSVNPSAKTISVKADLRDKIFKGSMVVISGATPNAGPYTVNRLDFDGTFTTLSVKEEIPFAAAGGTFSYARVYQILPDAAPDPLFNKITIKAEEDEKALTDFIAFMNATFMNHEGMHMVEHILLRPKNNGFVPLPADTWMLQEGLAQQGTLTYNKVLEIVFILNIPASNLAYFRVKGNVASQIPSDVTVGQTGDPLKDVHYTVQSSGYITSLDQTYVIVKPAFPDEINSVKNYVSYKITVPVLAAHASEKIFDIDLSQLQDVRTDSYITIAGSTGGVNDGDYKVLSVESDSTAAKLVVGKARFLQDKLLPVNLHQGTGSACDSCLIEDPYSFIVHVIIPYWPGRFTNRSFRAFLEQTIRQEAPAHLFFDICWINPDQMREFELKYKAWLVESARETPDVIAVSERLSDLIDILSRLKNVYPSGTLHDCDTDDTLETAVILNNSILGNA